MVDHGKERPLGENTSSVVFDLRGIDAARNRSTIVDLLLHGRLARNRSVVRNRRIGVSLESDASAAASGSGDFISIASPVGVGAVPLRGLEEQPR